VTSKLEQTLAAGRQALTAECLPPRSGDAGAIRKLADIFPTTLDAVVVADNPEEVGGSALATAAILAAAKVEAMLSVVTRDRNRVSLQADALGAAALGIRNLLCLSGQHQAIGLCPAAASAADIDSIQLTQAVCGMAREAVDFQGHKLPAPVDLFVGAVAHPYLRPLELNLIRLKKKVAAGAKFLLTQAVFDLAGFNEWMAAVRQAGLDRQTAIIASVLPLSSLPQAQQLQQRQTYGPVPQEVIDRLAKAADFSREGLALGVATAKQLKSIPGVRGIHILCGGHEQLAARLIKEAGLA
jgi:methylenetetrahydrofolate reductase (NADPH)